MRETEARVAEALQRSVTEDLRDTTWGVYPGYDVYTLEEDVFIGGNLSPPREREGTPRERRVPVVERRKKIRRYRPLVDKPSLVVEFARLAEQEVTEEKWRKFIHYNGVLGFERRSDQHRADDRGGRSETLSAFQRETHAAYRALRLFEAATRPDYEPDVNTIVSLLPEAPPDFASATVGEAKNLALLEVGELVQERLATETYPQLYLMPDESFRDAYGFRSLRGALWLQMLYLVRSDSAHRCRSCGRIIVLEKSGQDDTRKTYKNKRYCSPACRQADWRRRNRNQPS